MALKLIFMGTPEFALPTLKSLGRSEHELVAVYTQPPRPAGRGNKERMTPVHEYALTQGLQVETPVTLKDALAQERFRAFAADAAVVAAYGLLLPQAILDATRMGCINVHPSLLPRWRGAAPIQRAIMEGDKETGVVIMQMNAGLDTGDMLMMERFAIPESMNAGGLHDALSVMAGPMVLKVLEGLQANAIKPVKQSEAGVTYAKKITRDECRIDWREPAEAVRCKILGLSPHPGAHFFYNGEAIKILNAEIAFTTAPAGEVIDDQLTIGCGGGGAIKPTLIQRPGKKPMGLQEMLRGYSVPTHTRLE